MWLTKDNDYLAVFYILLLAAGALYLIHETVVGVGGDGGM